MPCLYISLSSVSRKDMSIASLNLGRSFWYFATMFSNTLGAMPEVSIAFRKSAFWMRFFLAFRERASSLSSLGSV